jgi:MoaA/NifB/PqqE/SkfB family radical SAM enzyme
MKLFDLVSARTARLPRTLWIELTSRCPFDCIFCTRASLRGRGEHLDFDLYRRVLDELERPQLLRLNYAGESGHYPYLSEAIALAKAAGAEVELVSALASLDRSRLQAALEAGLDRLTVSLHTLDAVQFDAIYRFGRRHQTDSSPSRTGGLEIMHERLQQVLAWRAQSPRPFMLDLAFVAMERNLEQLPAIARFAAELDIPVLAIHPLIQRDPLPLGTSSEHTEGRLNQGFQARLRDVIEQVRGDAPELDLQVSSFELSKSTELGCEPVPWPESLPPGAQIAGCDQSPFETVHILANGQVVVCEVTEKLPMGNLHQQSLTEIWHGSAYRVFRERHLAGLEATCRTCIYKRAHRPAPSLSRITGSKAPSAQLLRGWHVGDGGSLRWSSAEAALWLARGHQHRRLCLQGQLAQPSRPDANFEIRVNGNCLHRQHYSAPAGLELDLPLPADNSASVLVEFSCSDACSPHAIGEGKDVRELGFALIQAECR